MSIERIQIDTVFTWPMSRTFLGNVHDEIKYLPSLFAMLLHGYQTK